MFHLSSSKAIRPVLRGAILLATSALLSTNLPAQKTTALKESRGKATPIIGRVLADVGSIAFGAGLGPQYITFIFGVEEDGGARVAPVKISYAFFKSEGLPPESFFDYSKRYQLRAIRDPKCDESLKSLSYAENVDESGKPMQPTYILRVLDGAPKDVLKPDLVLPCYVLRPGKYKVVR